MNRRGVVVTDGNERATLAVVRSLGKQGIPVFVGAETPGSLAALSRYCTASFTYPSPWRDPQGYVDRLLEVIGEHAPAALFPMTDIAMELVGEQRAAFERVTALPGPTLDQYHALSDKVALARYAERSGVPVPATIYVEDGVIDAALAAIDRWPVVVKPGRSLLKAEGRWRKTGVLIARDADDLRKIYHDHWFLKQPSMIQAYVTGHGEGVFGIFEDGVPTELFAHRRLRERPPSGGVSVYREAIALPEPMTRYALRIMESVGWNGVAMIEFKVDPVSGTPYLMEVNGRFWGSLQLAIDAGVDFPMALYRGIETSARGRDVPTYRTGVRSQWWLGDLDHVVSRIKDLRRGAAPSAAQPSLLKTIGSLVNVFDRNTRNEMLPLSDPRPGLVELGRYAKQKVGAVRDKGGRVLTRATGGLSRRVAERRLRSGGHDRDVARRFPARAHDILVLCRGNICRSPFAEEWIRRGARARGLDVAVSSAGLDAIEGRHAFPMAETVAPRFGIDLAAHRARHTNPAMVDAADLILVMEPEHVRQMAALYPSTATPVFLLGHFTPGQPVSEIADPYGQSAERFSHCFDELVAACDGFLDELEKRLRG
jgi:protein-tyrosine-phosphatase/predicted ATP-grasp superfamily ATP-dependent carboligase